jgi:flagellar L-ring protein precursor FlgH
MLGLVLLAACTPSTSIRQPMTARPPEHKAVGQNNGAIFQAGINERPLFEDVRARNVGDTLTIVLAENTTAAQKNAVDATNNSSVNASTPTITVPLANQTKLKGIGVASSAADKTARANDSSGSNVLTGTIAVTVTEVLPNGNLVVSGEKVVAINQTDEYIRLSGVVNPRYIANDNSVQSTQVADAHIEYKGGNNHMDEASVLSMLGRFFLSVLPF